ncbi:hypothetical protein Vadar_008580 [Vaccinium darrowii]|uniref:Uncharacterized protein n=1 Tax=Vaccinium darrowii TaxID=229202 RepID=A0ACB7ZCG6_9ERIC|nr:hypothetical protein Vadar_008580 [Vaccinium darrowii]
MVLRIKGIEIIKAACHGKSNPPFLTSSAETENSIEQRVSTARDKGEGEELCFSARCLVRFIPGSPKPSALVREGLVRRARDFNIVLDDVAITHLSYGPEFSKAVEAKQGAQQVAERSKFVVAKADRAGETAAVIRAEAARLISEATKGAAVIRADGLRRIEVWREITAMLAKNPKVTYLPGDEGNGILWGLVVGESLISLILMLFGNGSVLVKFMNGGN